MAALRDVETTLMWLVGVAGVIVWTVMKAEALAIAVMAALREKR